MNHRVITAVVILAALSGTASAQDRWKGEFTITSVWNGLALDIPEGKSDNGLSLIQWGLHGVDGQRWRVESVDPNLGWHKIVNVFTGKALEVKDGAKEDRAAIIQNASNNSESQHWKLEKQMGGDYKIISRVSGKAMDIPFGSKEQGTPLEQCSDNGQDNQRWRFNPTIEFVNLMIIKKEFDIPGYRKGTVPESEIKSMTTAFEVTLPRMILTWSKGRVAWRNKVVVSSHTLKTTNGGKNPSNGGAEWVEAVDISQDLQDHVRWAQFDCIFVYLGYPFNKDRAYGGGGYSLLGAGLVTYSQFSGTQFDYDSEDMGGLFHEWCHSIAEDFYQKTLGVKTVPGIHHDVPDPSWDKNDYGKDTGGLKHWLNWYTNYLNGTVRSRNGKQWGLGEECWSKGTRRDYYKTREPGR